MKLLKKLSAVAVVVILVIGGSYFLFRTDNGKPKITNETIGVQVKELKELATIQYKYKEIASREDWNTLFNIKLPFTKSSFIVSYTGILKLGIDLSETKVDVDENSKTIGIETAFFEKFFKVFFILIILLNKYNNVTIIYIYIGCQVFFLYFTKK